MWIHYIGGTGKGDKLVAVAIGISPDPDEQLAALRDASPFSLRLLGIEEGDRERLEAVQATFLRFRLQGPWYRASEDLEAYIAALTPVERATKVRRISLDLPPEEFRDLERLVGVLGVKTKARLLRRALRLYSKLGHLKAQGWTIQAIKSGQLVQFPDLDADPD
jgi:hypothetical protein